jgi:hypothetical protein
VTNFTYDASGNMLSQTVAALGLEAATTTYSYDANGNKAKQWGQVLGLQLRK